MIVTENGVEDTDDHLRPRYLIQHIHQVWRAVNFNWPVKGYFHWSLVDNFEWERGWTQRFGLWELDVETQARRKRPSADLYAEICRTNGISSDMVAKYAPEIFEAMFPELRIPFLMPLPTSYLPRIRMPACLAHGHSPGAGIVQPHLGRP